jgi:hypothetical protein
MSAKSEREHLADGRWRVTVIVDGRYQATAFLPDEATAIAAEAELSEVLLLMRDKLERN